MSGAGRALRVSERAYRTLLVVAYPRGFRREYEVHMAQLFGDLCREEVRRGGMLGLGALWVRTLLDLVATAFVERSRAMCQGLSAMGSGLVSLRNLMLANAAVLLVSGVAFVNAPVLIDLYNLTLPPVGSDAPSDWASIAFARFFGVVCVGFGLLLWTTSRIAEVWARQAVSKALFVANSLGFVLLLIQQTQIWLSALGWITVAVHLLLALGYGLLWFTGTSTARPLDETPASIGHKL